DKKQSHRSLRPYVIEEAYEVVAAIDKRDPELLKEELGDLLLQIVLHAQIASEKKEFTMKDIVDVLKAKMIRRHPHVFTRKKIKRVEQVWANWEKIKRDEKKDKAGSFFSGIPNILPGLYRAQKIQKKAARVGFDWEHAEGAWQKVKEEFREFYAAYKKKNRQKRYLEEEIGDILFSLVNVSRKLKIDAESAMQQSTDKFIKRFEHMEKNIVKQNREIKDHSLKELDKLWEKSKREL
ncbi:nucleoside triphosphate pyrophosphohydrolase, partial [Candidatus Margulisiibacteriota bacterium]